MGASEAPLVFVPGARRVIGFTSPCLPLPLHLTASVGDRSPHPAPRRQRPPGRHLRARVRACAHRRDGDGQGLTLVHFLAQLEPFLTQNTPQPPLQTLQDPPHTT